MESKPELPEAEAREESPPPLAAGIEKETSEAEAIANLRAAVLYLGPDGTSKECGDRCSMHIESGKYKNRCTIHSPLVVIPNVASCGLYKKGPAPTGHMAMPMAPFVTPEQSGLIYGKVQCKRCVRADEDADICLALTAVLQKVMGFPSAKFEIEPDGCCNWQRGPKQEEPRDADADKGKFRKVGAK